MNAPLAAHRWIIVTQVKSHRVVYFTDDPEYQPPMEGDWYYCSPFEGALPAGMTLRNCWGWRFNGGVFTDARQARAKPGHESLMDSNRKALLGILRDKINSVREPFLPRCKQGDVIRAIKLEEATRFLRSAGAGDFPHLMTVATARNVSLEEAARLIQAKADETRRVLLETERFRESLTVAIEAAQQPRQLLELREWLLDRVAPELSREFAFRVEHTEPIDHNKPLEDTHRQHEIARLKAQLREAINAQRHALQSDYLQNDEIRKHKARQAQAVLAQGGAPPGLDLALLEGYALARGLDVLAAARLMVDSMAAAAAILERTEVLKDRLLARIEGLKTLADVRALSDEISHLEKS